MSFRVGNLVRHVGANRLMVVFGVDVDMVTCCYVDEPTNQYMLQEFEMHALKQGGII